MGTTVNRLASGATIALALLNTLSCSDSTAPNGLSSDDLSADASRIASISVTLTRATISVGDTTSAAAKLLDYRNQTLDRVVTWTSSSPAVATVDGNGLVTGVSEGVSVISASRGFKSGSATIAVVAAITTAGVGPGQV